MPLEDIGFEDEVFDNSGVLPRYLKLFRLPTVNPHQSMQFERSISLQPRGDNPIFVRVTLEDGTLCWTSPDLSLPLVRPAIKSFVNHGVGSRSIGAFAQIFGHFGSRAKLGKRAGMDGLAHLQRNRMPHLFADLAEHQGIAKCYADPARHLI